MIKLIVLLTRFVFTACLQQEISSLCGVAQPAVCNGGVLSIGRVFPRELVYRRPRCRGTSIRNAGAVADLFLISHRCNTTMSYPCYYERIGYSGTSACRDVLSYNLGPLYYAGAFLHSSC